tara:strand:- start:532 stop:735 length:204 start_codon:yes stop_codon:yes gene_type:complete
MNNKELKEAQNKEWLTLKEFRDECECCRTTVYNLVKSGKIEVRTLYGTSRKLIHRNELKKINNYIES